MPRSPETPMPPGGEPSAAPDADAAGAQPHAPARLDARSQPAILRSLSPRVTAALAVLMLAIGVAVGAAIGPAPTPSFAGASRLLPSLLASAAGGSPSTAPAQPPSPTQQTSPPAAPAPLAAQAAASSAAAPTTSQAPATSAPSTPGSEEGRAPTSNLAPVSNVWLIELSGSTFGEALAQPAAAPYITGQALGAGTLLADWSALAGGDFANAAALLAGTPPQLLSTIVQPPCPEGAAAAQCAAGTPGALAAADEFLKQSIPTITATPAYREHGLIVVTFASIAAGAASGLPSGSISATLTSQPPAGVLLMSPFATAGARSSTAFNATSPKQSAEKLLRR